MGFFGKLFGKKQNENQTKTEQSGFLSSLSPKERVRVSNLNPAIYHGVIADKKGNPTEVIIADSDGKVLELLKKLSIAEIETLCQSVEVGLQGDKASGSNMTEAAKLYKRAAEINPYNDLALMSCGCAFARQGQLREGIKWVEKAVQVNPDNERAKGNLRAMKADL